VSSHHHPSPPHPLSLIFSLIVGTGGSDGPTSIDHLVGDASAQHVAAIIGNQQPTTDIFRRHPTIVLVYSVLMCLSTTLCSSHRTTWCVVAKQQETGTVTALSKTTTREAKHTATRNSLYGWVVVCRRKTTAAGMSWWEETTLFWYRVYEMNGIQCT
jgi:hypothetical protein